MSRGYQRLLTSWLASVILRTESGLSHSLWNRRYWTGLFLNWPVVLRKRNRLKSFHRLYISARSSCSSIIDPKRVSTVSLSCQHQNHIHPLLLLSLLFESSTSLQFHSLPLSSCNDIGWYEWIMTSNLINEKRFINLRKCSSRNCRRSWYSSSSNTASQWRLTCSWLFPVVHCSRLHPLSAKL